MAEKSLIYINLTPAEEEKKKNDILTFRDWLFI
jgi:hypothetical protein